jgi:hypothetical protein
MLTINVCIVCGATNNATLGTTNGALLGASSEENELLKLAAFSSRVHQR